MGRRQLANRILRIERIAKAHASISRNGCGTCDQCFATMQWYTRRLHQIQFGLAPVNSIDLPPAVLHDAPFFGWLKFTSHHHAAVPFDSTFADGGFFTDYPENPKADVRSWN